MSILGKAHEISFYGILSAIIGITLGKFGINSLITAGFNVNSFSSFFLAYIFWSLVLFIPISVFGSFQTKFADHGVGLSFYSDKLLVILFAHIAEEILGLICTPFWFLRDFFSKNLYGADKIIDYITYFLELVFIIFGFMSLN